MIAFLLHVAERNIAPYWNSRKESGTCETMSNSDCMAEKDMTETMENTMQRLQGRFHAISEQLETKHEMGTRIDDLEKNVSDLMTQAGMEDRQISK